MNIKISRRSFLKTTTISSISFGLIPNYSAFIFNDQSTMFNHEYISSGFKDLDSMINGFRNSQLILISGRPSMGKTGLSLAFAVSAMANHHRPVLFFSCDYKDQLMQRISSSQAGLDLQNKGKDYFSISRINHRVPTSNRLTDNVYIEDIIDLKEKDMFSIAKKMQQLHHIGMIVIDYIPFIHCAGNFKSHGAYLEKITFLTKMLARELKLPVIIICPCNKGPEGRSDKRPVMADLAHMGESEKYADIILLPYRDCIYNPATAERNLAEISVAKNRGGKTGKIKLNFNSTVGRFEELS